MVYVCVCMRACVRVCVCVCVCVRERERTPHISSSLLHDCLCLSGGQARGSDGSTPVCSGAWRSRASTSGVLSGSGTERGET